MPFNIGNKKEYQLQQSSQNNNKVTAKPSANSHNELKENIYIANDIQVASFFAIALLLVIVFILFRRLFKLDDQVSELSKQMGEMNTKLDIKLEHLEEELKDLKK